MASALDLLGQLDPQLALELAQLLLEPLACSVRESSRSPQLPAPVPTRVDRAG